MAPVIWPRSDILQSAAASIVDGTFAVTVLHGAARIATRTCQAHRMAEIDRVLNDVDLGLEIGAILNAASVMICGLGCPFTSLTKQWLMRLLVRIPVAFYTTAPISSSLCMLPFMSASARPATTNSTAFVAES